MKIARVKALLGLYSIGIALSRSYKKMEQKTEKSFQHLVRIANTDLNGTKQIAYALRKIKGVGFVFAHMSCALTEVDPTKKAGELSVGEVQKLNDFIKNPQKFGAPVWVLNRRKDPVTGENSHLIGSDIAFTKDNDIKKMKKIKCYKGVRHIAGLPCRGQKTKSNFRKTKCKGKGGLGVIKKKVSKRT